MTRPITFLSDYGYSDDFVGVCHGVIATICPDARVIDVAHGLERHGVRPAAVMLRNALPYMPPGIHLAIVDPEVGSARRAVALVVAGERILLGPDNGLLMPAAVAFGGVREAFDVTRSSVLSPSRSATFHGRDVFAPIAAHLAGGALLEELGERLDPGALAPLELPAPRVEPGLLRAHVLYLDHFGNAQLDATLAELEAAGIAADGPVELESAGERYFGVTARTFADVRTGEILLFQDSSGALAVAINRGDAAETLQLGWDSEVSIRPA